MIDPVTFAVIISTQEGLRHVVSSTENGAAQSAEMILRALGAGVCSSTFWVQSEDQEAAMRLTCYLRDVKTEMVTQTALGIGLG